MARPMKHTPRRESATVDDSLRAEVVQRDQCGMCGCWFTPGPDDLPGVCRYDQMYMGGGAYASAG